MNSNCGNNTSYKENENEEVSNIKNPTNNKWIVWYHNPSDKNWGIESYKDILEISSIEDFWVLKNSWDKCLPKVSEGMFFLMRKKGDVCIYPQWEDPNNTNGGYWSFKVTKTDSENVWFELMMFMLGECITNDHIESLNINGISISPKKNFCIVKIWNKDSIHNDNDLLSLGLKFLNMEEVLYTSHKKNIEKDQIKIKRREYYATKNGNNDRNGRNGRNYRNGRNDRNNRNHGSDYHREKHGDFNRFNK